MARPPFVPTKAQRLKVARLKAGGMTNEAIALVIGVGSRMTLDKYFAAELTTGASKVRSDAIEMLRTLGMKGNASALSKWLKITEAAPPPAAPPPVEEPERPAKIGKKEQADITAQTAAKGNAWGELVH